MNQLDLRATPEEWRDILQSIFKIANTEAHGLERVIAAAGDALDADDLAYLRKLEEFCGEEMKKAWPPKNVSVSVAETYESF